MQLLMDVHGAGLERMMEIIFESGSAGPAIIDKLGQDSIAGSLLLLYSLHPDDLETRVHKAMERMRPRLRKLACTAELASVSEGVVRVRLTSDRSQLRVICQRSASDGGRRQSMSWRPTSGRLKFAGWKSPRLRALSRWKACWGTRLSGGSASMHCRPRAPIEVAT